MKGATMMSDESKLTVRPLFLVKPNSMSREDIQRAEEQTGICIVECAEPESARFVEPPIDVDISAQARAALLTFRAVVRNSAGTFYKTDIMKWFIDVILEQPAVQRVATVKK